MYELEHDSFQLRGNTGFAVFTPPASLRVQYRVEHSHGYVRLQGRVSISWTCKRAKSSAWRLPRHPVLSSH